MSVNLLSIFRSPLITERSSILREKFNQYVFKVHPDATKIDIREAVKKVFKVEVKHVRTANFKGKMRRLAVGRPQGRRIDWKKAFVTLKKGQEIKLEQEVGK